MIRRYTGATIIAFFVIVLATFLLPNYGAAYNKSWDQGHKCCHPNEGGSTWGRYDYDGVRQGEYTSKECCELLCKICPVYVNTGQLQKTFTDLTVPGVGPAVAIVRTYNSQDWATSLLGHGWTFNFGKRLIITRDKDGEKIVGVVLHTGEKNFYKEHPDGTLERLTEYGATYDLIKNSDNTYTIANRNGSRNELREDGKIAKIIDQNHNELVFSYNSVGCLSRLTNASGNYVDFQLGPNGKIASLSDNLGRTVAYTYDGNGNLTSVTDPIGNTRQYVYNSGNLLAQIIDAKGNVVESSTYDNNQPSRVSTFIEKGETYTIAYFDGRTEKSDSQGNKWTYYFNDVGVIERVVDPLGNESKHQLNKITATSVDWKEDLNGNRTTYTYDADGNVASKTDPLGNTWTYSYVAGTDLVETETNPLGVVTKYEYDTNGNLIKLIKDFAGSLENTTSYSYDSWGRQTGMTDSLGHTTGYEYDAIGNLVKSTDSLGNISTYTYDSIGNRLTEIGALGNTTTYSYDLLGRLLSMTDPLGNTTTYTYDAGGNRISETDPKGSTTTFVYDAYNRLIQTTDVLGNTITKAYDSRDNQTSMTDANGHVTIYTYDILDRLTRETNALGGQANYTHDAVGNVLTVTDANGNTVTFSYDATNRKISETNAAGKAVTYAYDALNMISMTDANGNTTSNFYDSLGRQIKKKNALNGDTTYGYDTAGNLLNVTDANGNTTTFTYNAINRRISQINAADDTTTYGYDANGNPVTEIRPNGNTITSTYDSLNRKIGMADSLGPIKSITYGPSGRVLTETNGLGETTSYSYNALNRRISQTDPMGNITAYTYDASDNVLTITDPEGSVKQFSYNNLNQRISVTDSLGHTTTYSYDTAGQLLSITDPKGNQTSILYDETNKVTKKTYADGTFYTYTYDPAGNLASRIDAKGQVTTYTYDNLNRLTRVDYLSPEYKEFSYDSMGNMLSANTDDTSISFLWDSAYRMTQTTQNGHNVNYAYNLSENSRTITYPNGKVVKEIHNQRNLLNRIEDGSSASIINYTLDGASRLQKKNYANGIEATYNRNANGLATTLEYKKAGVQLIGLGYNHNADNTIKYKEKMHVSDSSEIYSYDGKNQLTSYKVGQLTAGNIPNPSTETDYVFDPMGNWDSMTTNGATQNRSHNPLNQITSIDAVNFLYDPNGNLIDDGNKTYDYNTENRLIKVTRKSDSQVLAQYKYDALGRRVSKSTATKATNFIYDGISFLTLAELSSSGSTEKTFLWGMDLSGGKEIGGIGGLIEVEDINTGSNYVCLNDVNGNIVMLADADTGQITGEYTYSAFGRLVSVNGMDAAANPFRFSSKYHDGETGFYYYGFRYYSPELGRWLNRDPIEENGGLNLYRFVENNSINDVDLFGEYTLGYAKYSLCSKRCSNTNLFLRKYCVDICILKLSKTEIFEEWLILEKNDTSWLSGLKNCPNEICVINKTPANCNNGQWDKLDKPNPKHHPYPTEWCMRSSNVLGSGQQCCYNIKGKLVKKGLAAGTPDRYTGKWQNTALLHWLHDVDTYDLAVELGRAKNDYLTVRPPNQGGGKCYN